MFTKTRLSLTFFYSILFLGLFWLFSFGLYFWMDRSFGEGYISQVKQRQVQQNKSQGEFNDKNTPILVTAGDIALDQLRTILLTLNGILFFIIPTISWYLAKRTLSPIEKIHEKQKRFVSDASHELQTPITIMTGEIDVALNNARSPQEYKDILKSNKEELTRLSLLVENLLFLSHDDQHKVNLHMDAIDITDVLTSVIVQLKPVYTKKHLDISFIPSEVSVQVVGNEALLRQLFFNLIDNAIKYTPSGSISIKVETLDKFVTVAIKDTGIGIDHTDTEKLFDRFYRVDSSRSEIRGYGLGLSICKAIITRHHGEIRVESSKGKGATFIVSLPKVIV